MSEPIRDEAGTPSRRDFMEAAGLAATVTFAHGANGAADAAKGQVPRRTFGRAKDEVSILGIGALVLSFNGRSTVNSSLRQQQIVGTPDMTPSAIKAEGQKAGLSLADARRQLEQLEQEVRESRTVTVSLAWQIMEGGDRS